ncbi:MAG: energy transducer TonB [Terriglobales bacterium]
MAQSWATSTPAPLTPTIVQATLTGPGSRPFHLKAEITERGDPDSKTDVEIFWMAPDKWRRTIRSKTEFSQTLIVNGDQVFEQDSDDYFPLWSRTLVTAMVDPKVVLDAVRPGDRLQTKANGMADESGRLCFGVNHAMCMTSRFGLQESIGAAGHSVDFTDYRDFHGNRVARILVYHVDHGDSYESEVTELRDLKKPDPALFNIEKGTPRSQRIGVLPLPEVELRSMALQPLKIIWPQVLDGATSGTTSYYVSIDRLGTVEEVLPLSISAERADDVARRQIKKWKFKPTLQDGVAVQAEGVLNFDFNTRAYGPAEPLTDEEIRKLATHVVEPVFPSGLASGSSHIFWVAVDEEGNVIETISGEGPSDLSSPGMQAIGKWRFGRLVLDGKPVPYRAQIVFRVP